MKDCYNSIVLLLAACLLGACGTKKPQDKVEEDHSSLYEYGEQHEYEVTPEVAAWLQRIPIDSAERVLCSHYGWIQLGDSMYSVCFYDVLHCCPEKVMDYSFSELADSMDLVIHKTDDGRLLIVHWDTGRGGTSPDIARYTLFRADDGTVHLLEGSYDSPQLIDIHSLKTRKGETVYLLHDYFRAWSSHGASWVWGCRIKGNTLDTLALFPHGDTAVGIEYNIPGWYFSTNDDEGWDWLFELHGNDLYIPVEMDDVITDRYNLYRWNGTSFDSVGNVGNRRLHKSLQQYEELTTYFVTKGFRIRIDKMADGSYRYASWPRSRETSTKPDLIINGGRFDEDNGYYLFENEGYTYKVGGDYNASDRSSFQGLIVEKAGKELLRQAIE